jgi:hypothetical protein
MRKFNVLFLVLTLVLLSGCAGVVSLHPLAVPNGQDGVFDPALLGTWEEVSANPDGPPPRYVVARAESGYAVTAGPTEAKCTMQLVKAGDRYLLDVHFPSDDPPVPVHLFLKLRLDKDAAWVAEMDSDWLEAQIKTSGVLRHEVLTEDHGRILLTASTSEMRSFLLPYVKDDRSFGEETELRRIK